MIIECIFFAIGGYDPIEFYVDILQITLALIIIYLFFGVNKSFKDKNLKIFALSNFAAKVGALIIYLIYIFVIEVYFTTAEFLLFKLVLSILFAMILFFLYLYAWDHLKRFFIFGSIKFPERYAHNGLGGAKNLFVGYILMVVGTLLTIILIGIFILFIGIIFVIVGYIRLAYFITIKDFEGLTSENSHVGELT